nr:MAG TPA: phosphoadenosine-phosphosulfate reductase [Ackermannviridae sp.]
MNKHDAGELRDLQALPLEEKINLTKRRIIDWYDHYRGNVYVSFSGGKDSTVLLDLVRETLCDDSIPAVFANTGLEYAQIQRFVRDTPNAEIVRPSMRFDEVVSTYGYPIISKEVAGAIYYARKIRNSDDANTSTRKREEFLGTRSNSSKQSFRRMVLLGRFPRSGMTGTTGAGGVFSQPLSQFNQKKWLAASQELPFLIGNKCCDVMKKKPMRSYARKNKSYPFVATLAEESRQRKLGWMINGCNAFDAKSPISTPMAFWTNHDVLLYIKQKGLPICEVYGDIVYTDADGNTYDTAFDEAMPLTCTKCQRTGCVYCGFGAHAKNDNRFLQLAELSPRQYEYAMQGGQWADNPYYDATAPKMDGQWKNWNPKKIWVPSKEGLGIRFVIDQFNALYPENKIKY